MPDNLDRAIDQYEPQPTSIRAELAAMRKIAAALDGLDPAARDRVACWVFDRWRNLTEPTGTPKEPTP